MSKPHILVADPAVRASGGASLVAAWVLQALREDFQVSLATLEPVDHRAVNRSFGTNLRERDYQVLVAPPRFQRILRSFPTPGSLLQICLTMRWAQDLDRRYRYDVLFSTQNEADFHRPGIQYVHFPWIYLPRPEAEMRWYHRIPGSLAMYRRSCMALARATLHGLGQNVMLANSRFVAGLIQQVYRAEAQVLNPPVPGEFPEVPWERRRLAMAAVGRIHPEKRWHLAVDIVESIRRRGHPLELTLIGHDDAAAYAARLQGLAAARPWFRFLRGVDRPTLLAELSQHRYGIHLMPREHFGIAPAELQRAGCIPFVHNSGGPLEIVDGDPRLTFDSAEDATERIVRAIEDPILERDLRVQMETRRRRFSSEKFCESLRTIVASFANQPVSRA